MSGLLKGLLVRKDYEPFDVQACELAVLQGLDWDISLPTAFEISNYLVSAVYGSLSVRKVKKLLKETAFFSQELLVGKTQN